MVLLPVERRQHQERDPDRRQLPTRLSVCLAMSDTDLAYQLRGRYALLSRAGGEPRQRPRHPHRHRGTSLPLSQVNKAHSWCTLYKSTPEMQDHNAFVVHCSVRRACIVVSDYAAKHPAYRVRAMRALGRVRY
eukprot:3933897-Rhodomonas_salina.5